MKFEIKNERQTKDNTIIINATDFINMEYDNCNHTREVIIVRTKNATHILEAFDFAFKPIFESNGHGEDMMTLEVSDFGGSKQFIFNTCHLIHVRTFADQIVVGLDSCIFNMDKLDFHLKKKGEK